MLLVFVIILIGSVAFFHYLQGLFSAAISAMIAVIATVVAIGWHENLVATLLGGKMADSANAIGLCALFAVTYLVLRLLFDMLMPGNVRFHVAVDKAGAAIMGLVAGVCVAGIAVVAAQSLPFPPSVGGYSRFAFGEEQSVVVAGVHGKGRDATYRPLIEDDFRSDKAAPLLLPVDDFVLSVASRLSADTGSLSNGKPLLAIHPDYLQELFGQRLGIELGGKHVMLPNQFHLDANKELPSVLMGRPREQRDAESTNARNKEGSRIKPLKFTSDETLLVVRGKIGGAAGETASDEKDHLIRLSMGSLRLVYPNADGAYTQLFAVGILDHGCNLYLQAADDYVILPSTAEKCLDIAFKVPVSAVTVKAKAGAPLVIAPGVFVEVKRMARVDLSDERVANDPTKDLPVVNGYETSLALRKPVNPAMPSPGDPRIDLTPKIVGNFHGVGDTGYLSVTITKGGLSYTISKGDGAPPIEKGAGTWKLGSQDASTIVIDVAMEKEETTFKSGAYTLSPTDDGGINMVTPSNSIPVKLDRTAP